MRKLLAVVFTFLTFGSFVTPAFAQTIQTCPQDSPNFNPLCAFTAASVPNFISGAITIVLIIAVVIAIFFLLLGGIRWITSGGDKAKVDEARKQIVAAIIGLVVAFLAFFIIRIVANIFGVNVTQLQLPTIKP